MIRFSLLVAFLDTNSLYSTVRVAADPCMHAFFAVQDGPLVQLGTADCRKVATYELP